MSVSVALYEYQCMPNGHRFEVRHGMNEYPVHVCLECQGHVRRVITAPGIVFKGSGFYVTDSRKPPTTSDNKPTSGGGEALAKSVPSTTTIPATGGDVKATQ